MVLKSREPLTSFLLCTFKENEQKIGIVIQKSFHYINIMPRDIAQPEESEYSLEFQFHRNYQDFPLTFTTER